MAQHSHHPFNYEAHNTMCMSTVNPTEASWACLTDEQSGLNTLGAQSGIPLQPTLTITFQPFDSPVSGSGAFGTTSYGFPDPLRPTQGFPENTFFPGPLERFYYDSESPWHPQRHRQAGDLAVPSGCAESLYQTGSATPRREWRDATSSEIGSVEASLHLSDSGYGTAPQTQSIASAELNESHQDCGELTGRTDRFALVNSPPNASPLPEPEQSGLRLKGRSSSQRRHPLQTCPHCSEKTKCPSDFKKHLLKHTKPHKCDVEGCKRSKDGFTTINDLNRHKKSVHKVNQLQDSYQCVAEKCKNRDKVWTRLDNFKQHIIRMHGNENVEELVRRSEISKGERVHSSTPKAMSATPIETTFAGLDIVSEHLAFSAFSEGSPGRLRLTPDYVASSFYAGSPEILNEFELHATRQRIASDPAIAESQDPTSGLRSFDLLVPSSLSDRVDMIESSPRNMMKDDVLSTLDPSAIVVTRQRHSPSKEAQVSDPSSTRGGDLECDALEQLSSAIAAKVATSDSPARIQEAIRQILRDAALEASSADPGVEQRKQRSASQDNTSRRLQRRRNSANAQPDPKNNASILLRFFGSPSNSVVPSATHSSPRKCTRCEKVIDRECDLRKHMKRHTRPYGCTFPKCKKAFGSKNDWKRHENSQHFQFETYRCQMRSNHTTGVDGVCAQVFYEKAAFRAHLSGQHSVQAQGELDEQCRVRRIGRNGQDRFWCGFCKAIVELTTKRNEAWNERFNHIDEHFKKGEKIEDWLCIEGKRTKGEIYIVDDRSVFEPEEAGSSATEDTGLGTESGRIQEPTIKTRDRNASTQLSSPMTQPSLGFIPSPTVNTKKRKRPTHDQLALNARREVMRYCCNCNQGPYPHRLHVNCINCQHTFCDRCALKTAHAGELDFAELH